MEDAKDTLLKARRTKLYMILSHAEFQYAHHALEESTFVLWIHLNKLAAPSGDLSFECTIPMLSKLTEKSGRTLRRQLGALEKKGFLIRERLGQEGTRYQLTMPQDGLDEIASAPDLEVRVERCAEIERSDKASGDRTLKGKKSKQFNKMKFDSNDAVESVFDEEKWVFRFEQAENFGFEDLLSQAELDVKKQHADFMREAAKQRILFSPEKKKALKNQMLSTEAQSAYEVLLEAEERHSQWRQKQEKKKQKTVKATPEKPEKTTSEPELRVETAEIRLEGFPQTLMIEKRVYDKALKEIPKLHKTGALGGDVGMFSLKELLDGVLYHTVCGGLQGSQLHRYHAARKMAKQGTFTIPRALSGFWSYLREKQAKLKKKIEMTLPHEEGMPCMA